MNKILFVDYLNAVWRANISFGWGSKPEVDTQYNTVYNFFRNLRATVEQFAPNKIFIALEGHPKFRHELYPQYKANRIVKTASQQDTHDKLHANGKIILDLLQCLPVTLAKASEYEADDTIATLVDLYKDDDLTVFSSDSDYTQLLQKGYSNLQIYNPIKKVFLTAPEYPYVGWKALNGDKTDNIKKLLSDKKSLAMINDPDKFAQFLSVEENRAAFQMNRELIEFKMIPVDEIMLQDGKPNYDLLFSEFTKMSFASYVNPKTKDKFIDTFKAVK